MLNFVIGIIVGGVVIGILIFLVMKSKTKNITSAPATEKEQNIEKLKDFISKSGTKITNNMVQKELKISDATATRYLEELEREGFIRQVGSTGKHVYYQKP